MFEAFRRHILFRATQQARTLRVSVPVRTVCSVTWDFSYCDRSGSLSGLILNGEGGIMEYIGVHFYPRDIRWVIAYGNIIGTTETELTLPSNFYVITLSGVEYSPPNCSGVVTATVPSNPLRISFAKV